MKASELTTKLAAMFPGSFSSPAGAAAWAEVYQQALGSYEGKALRWAFDDVMASWGNGYAPKPSDFVAKANEYRRRSSTGGGINRKQVWEQMRSVKPAMIADWWRQNSDLIDGYLANFPEDRRASARFWLGQAISDRAHLAAQQRIIRGQGEIEMTDLDWQHLIGQVDTRFRLEAKQASGFKRIKVSHFLRDGPPAAETAAWVSEHPDLASDA